jgi:hypothetical protein
LPVDSPVRFCYASSIEDQGHAHLPRPQRRPVAQRQTPEDLPHGILEPPVEVRAIVDRERQKHPPEAFAKAEVGVLNLETIAWYVDGLCHEVIYRETPQPQSRLQVARIGGRPGPDGRNGTNLA